MDEILDTKDALSEKLNFLTAKNPRTVDYLSRRLALGVEEGNCTHYITRKKRFCSHRAVAGSINGTCTLHSDEALNESRQNDKIAKRKHSEKLAGLVSNESTAEQQSKKRVSAPKRMANPFSKHMTPAIDRAFDWNSVYCDPAKPLHIDVGCAKGRCIAKLSQKPERAGWNHLGLEIRDSLVVYSKQVMTEADRDRKNLHFMTNNFAVTADELLSTLPAHCVRLVSFQFPDPWRRAKHAKRLIVQPRLIAILSRHMSAGACIYLSSDCDQVAERMRNEFVTHGGDCFKLIEDCSELFVTSDDCSSASSFHSKITVGTFINTSNSCTNSSEDSASGAKTTNTGTNTADTSTTGIIPAASSSSSSAAAGVMSPEWIRFNPLDEPSERELVCEVEWKRVWRCVFVRTESAPLDIPPAQIVIANRAEGMSNNAAKRIGRQGLVGTGDDSDDASDNDSGHEYDEDGDGDIAG